MPVQITLYLAQNAMCFMTHTLTPFRPELSLPEEEGAELRNIYTQADVILEYGSGGSTVMASEMANKLVFSVESDRDWALNLQLYIDIHPMLSPAIMHFVYIGPVGAWGRPINASQWKNFYQYPLNIWDQPFFRHPDVVLIDGRFRAACLAVTQLKIKRPVTVVFDDYVGRPAYKIVERMVGKPRTVGRMAIFQVHPAPLSADGLSDLMACMTQATYADGTGQIYKDGN